MKLTLLTILSSILFLMPVYAEEKNISSEITENSEITPFALMTFKNVVVSTSNKNIKLEVDIVVNDGTSKIVEVKNIRLYSVIGNIDINSVSWGSPQYWSGGDYATIGVTFKEDGTVKSDLVYCYP